MTLFYSVPAAPVKYAILGVPVSPVPSVAGGTVRRTTALMHAMHRVHRVHQEQP